MAVAFDEMNGPGGDLRSAYSELSRWLKETPPDALEYRQGLSQRTHVTEPASMVAAAGS